MQQYRSLQRNNGRLCSIFYPNSIDDIIEKLEKILFSNSARKELVIKTSKKLSSYSWKKCAKETLDIYNK